MKAARHQIEQECDTNPGTPFDRAGDMMTPSIIARSSSPSNLYYGLGLIITTLPARLSLLGADSTEQQ